jgi:hypothetical protein
MKEKNFQTEFGKRNTVHGVFELKLCKQRSLPFNSVAKHQVRSLSNAENNGIYHKISDTPVSWQKNQRFTRSKPFDCFYLKCDAYVVIMFYEPRKKKNVYYIRIVDWIDMQRRYERKSITEDMAKKVARYIVSYNKKQEVLQ